jgi:hypothetical protein
LQPKNYFKWKNGEDATMTSQYIDSTQHHKGKWKFWWVGLKMNIGGKKKGDEVKLFEIKIFS